MGGRIAAAMRGAARPLIPRRLPAQKWHPAIIPLLRRPILHSLTVPPSLLPRIQQHPAERRDRARASRQLQRPPRRSRRQQRDPPPARLLPQRTEPILQASSRVRPASRRQTLPAAGAGCRGLRRARLARPVPRGVRPWGERIRRVGARIHRGTQRRARIYRRGGRRGAPARAVRAGTRTFLETHRRVVALGHRETLTGDGAGCRGRRRRRLPRAADPIPGRQAQATSVRRARAGCQTLGGFGGSSRRGGDFPEHTDVFEGCRRVRAETRGDRRSRGVQAHAGARAARRLQRRRRGAGRLRG